MQLSNDEALSVGLKLSARFCSVNSNSNIWTSERQFQANFLSWEWKFYLWIGWCPTSPMAAQLVKNCLRYSHQQLTRCSWTRWVSGDCGNWTFCPFVSMPPGRFAPKTFCPMTLRPHIMDVSPLDWHRHKTVIILTNNLQYLYCSVVS